MFDAASAPRVFGLAPGVDFPEALVNGLLARADPARPEALGRVHLIVNTARMERRVHQLFDAGPARLLPKVHLVTRLDMLDPALAVGPAVNPLRRRLELSKLVARLIENQPDLAPRTSLYALTDSLSALMDEMQGEGVNPHTIRALDVSDQSEHWQRTQTFIGIVDTYLNRLSGAPDSEGRQRALVAALEARWQHKPPANPVILAGSTGSRGTTLRLIEAIARLPQGAIVLPGFDFDMPESAWDDLGDPLTSQDHPQYRCHALLRSLGATPQDVEAWHDTPPACAARNRLISLSLRPAPVTHAWLTEGPAMTDLATATARMTLLEAPNPRMEALAIALRLRKAVNDGQRAAVITPDRVLTRQITAALEQWDILPDDSAGAPLHLSPPGRFLRHVVHLFHRRLDAEALLTLLKHPLTHSSTDRGKHVLNTQRLEVRIRREGLPYPDADGIRRLSRASDWADWVARILTGVLEDRALPLSDWVARHMALSEAIAAGPDGADSGELWRKKAGEQARQSMDTLAEQSAHGDAMTALDYANLVGALLAEGEVRDRDAPHPDVMFWGTLEARVQGADLVILAGLNDGTWPEAPDPDPWLNRTLRRQAGLLLPDRRIGLAAHDYQQAVAAPDVWLARAIRSEDAETVASRWLYRLQNLLEGLKSGDGPAHLKDMRGRGDGWLARARAFEKVTPEDSAPRPSPRPPLAARPSRLSVTEVKTLIRDPYAVYARHVLRLRKLGPLVQNPDALSRGTVLHDVMERFVRASIDTPGALSAQVLIETTDRLLADNVPWPAARALWAARIARIADWFVAREIARRQIAAPALFENEAQGEMTWPDLGITLVARADRIDRTDAGAALIYDYKTGAVPTKPQQIHFDKQLLIEAAMIEEGAFATLGACPVAGATFIGLGTRMAETPAPLDDEPPAKVLAELRQLFEAYRDRGRGYTARRMMEEDRFTGDYDLLARHGEWDVSHTARPEDLT